MNTEELSNRLTQIVQGITNTHPIRIKATIEVFLEEFDPIYRIRDLGQK
jgi:hypothetical protein